jgi:N-acetylmuramoyl-L-alanine amidase
VRVPLGIKVPYEIVTTPDGSQVKISLFNTVSNTDWVDYKCSSRVVQSVQWFQDDTETYSLRVNTRPDSWWGYDARFENTVFVLELKSPPALNSGDNPMKGIVVAVDAGHSTDTGAIGPLGTLEKDVNLSIAKSLEQKLIVEGVTVVMTRKGDESGTVGLYDRRRTAVESNADIFVSVHNNALPEGENPFEKNGYGIYYFHPQSLSLAREIHQSYGETFGIGRGSSTVLRDDYMHYGDLALTRPPQFPAVLTESAYIIVPREEALLLSKPFQDEIAYAITAGIKRYVTRMRTK